MDGYHLHHVAWEIVDGTVAADGTAELLLGPVPTGKLWEVESVSLVDHDNAITAGIFFFRGAGQDILIGKLANPGAGFPVNYVGQSIHALEGYTVGVSLTGGTDGDKVSMYVHYHEQIRDLPSGNVPAEV